MANFAPCKSQTKANPRYPFHSRFDENGRIIYSVPLEVPEDTTLDTPVEDEENCTYTMINYGGGISIRVHFVEIADETFAFEQVRWLNSLHIKEGRYQQRNQLLPANYRVESGDCVWDQSPKMRRNDDGYVYADYSDLPERIEAIICEKLPTSDLYLEVYQLHVIGIEPKEIGERLGIEQSMVYFYRNEALKIAQEYRRLYFDEGDYKFPETFKSKRTRRKTD